ncbi:hypothetical protein [Rhodomicrobium lacus]|uniref:hypothetical protein n=1 Tax=Rhodomicrobium lacus TaxID=2498452 RepID=UPI000F8D0CFF|nr:hypothetical protein [Rhodomicrobium lacus]
MTPSFTSAISASAISWALTLNGAIHLVQGNHDAETLKHHAGLFASVSLIKEIEAGGHRIVMCHYPMREWDGSWTGSWHLFGHVHGRLNHAPLGFSLDVAADAHDFTPWSLDEIEAELKDRENPFAVHERPFRSQRSPSR